MESFKQYAFKGLDLKSSKILKPADRASAVDNVHIDPHNKFSLIKRYGLTTQKAVPDLVDVIYYKTGAKWIYVCTTGLYEDDGLSVKNIPFAGYLGLDANYTVPVSYQEINGCLYITDPAGNNDMFKYDGINFYKAGIPPLYSITDFKGSSTESLIPVQSISVATSTPYTYVDTYIQTDTYFTISTVISSISKGDIYLEDLPKDLLDKLKGLLSNE